MVTDHSQYRGAQCTLSTRIKTGDCFGVVLISGQNAARLEGGEGKGTGTIVRDSFYQHWQHKEEVSLIHQPALMNTFEAYNNIHL